MEESINGNIQWESNGATYKSIHKLAYSHIWGYSLTNFAIIQSGIHSSLIVTAALIAYEKNLRAHKGCMIVIITAAVVWLWLIKFNENTPWHESSVVKENKNK